MRALLPLIALLLAAPPAPAEEVPRGPKVLAQALVDEMERTIERLEMSDLGKPYFAAFTAADTRRLTIKSSFGGLKATSELRTRAVRVDLRVGSRKFDNMHYAGRDYWRYRPLTGPLVREDDYDALRYGIWRVADEAYKSALEKLSQKKAYKQNKLIKEEFPDLSNDPVAAAHETLPKELPFNRGLWERRLRRLSALFKRYPAIQDCRVNIYWTQRYSYLVDSEGRRVLKPDHDFEIYMEARAQAADGMRLKDLRRFISQSVDDMPPFSLLEAQAVGLAKGLTKLTRAPLLKDAYIGPVLLEEQAAGEFFNQLLAKNISSPREIWVENETAADEFQTGALSGRLGLRVLSPFLNVEDDPTLTKFQGRRLIGHYEIDDEGIPARRVRLIEHGILKDLLMNRAPVKKRDSSNGHGRGAFWEHSSAHISNLIISSEETMGPAALRRELLKRAEQFGLDHAYIIRRIDKEESKTKDAQLLADPILLYRVSVKTGREELVRNAKFTGVTLRALRDIAAAGNKRHVYNFYRLGPYKGAGRGQVQASIVHPSILVAEMELKKSDKKPDKPPYLPRPPFSNR